METTEELAVPAIADPGRLDALQRTGLLDTPPDEDFDRVTKLAAKLLDVPVVFVSLVDEHRQFFKSVVGVEGLLASVRETPLEHSFCRFSVDTGERLIVDDARRDALVSRSIAIDVMGVVAYAGIPITTEAGHVLGNVCAVDHEPRAWQDWEVELLEDLTAMLASEVRYRLKQRRLSEVESMAVQLERPVQLVGDSIRAIASAAPGPSRERQVGTLLDRYGTLETAAGQLQSAVREHGEELTRRPRRVDLVAHLRALAELAAPAADRSRLHLEVPDDVVLVEAVADVLDRAITHLLVTGLHHLAPGERLSVELVEGATGVRLVAAIPGQPLAASEVARLVTRLHHAVRPGEDDEASLRSVGGRTVAVDGPVQGVIDRGGTTIEVELDRV